MFLHHDMDPVRAMDDGCQAHDYKRSQKNPAKYC